MSWREVPLSDVCSFENGDRGKNYPGKSALLDQGKAFVNAGDLTDGALRIEGLNYISPYNYDKLSNGKFSQGDFLFCLRGSLGKFAFVDRAIQGAIASSLVIIRPKHELHVGYLKQYLASELCANEIALHANGAAQPNLAASSLKRFRIPLPPLDEQKRIAAILDKADALRRKRRQAIALLDSLTQSIFLEMFGDLTENQNGFPAGHISDWVADFETGKNLAPDPDNSDSLGFRVLKVSAVTSGIFKPEEAKPLPKGYSPPNNHFVKLGDLLFSRANTADLIGATALVDTDHQRLVLPDKIWRFIWRRQSAPNPLFIHALFSSSAFRTEISKRASGTSGSMKNISKDKVLSIPIGLPERHHQDKFAKRIENIKASRRNCVFQLNFLETLFSSLQHRAFSGQI